MTQKFQIKNSSLKIEDIKIDVFYAISISPDDNHQEWGIKKDNQSYKQRLDLFKTNQSLLINRILQPCRYKLFLEISPLGRLHWHGKIKFVDMDCVKRFYLTQIHQLTSVATFELDEIEDDDKWQAYITKQNKIWNIIITSEDKISKLSYLGVSEVIYKKVDEYL
jgi:hypothetical protein